MPNSPHLDFYLHRDRVTGKDWLEVFVVSAHPTDPTDIDLNTVYEGVDHSQHVRQGHQSEAALTALLRQVVAHAPTKDKRIDVLTLVGHASPGNFVFVYTDSVGAPQTLALSNKNFQDVTKLIPPRQAGAASDLFEPGAEVRFLGCRLAMHPTWANADEDEDGELLLRRIAFTLNRNIVAPTRALDHSMFDKFGFQNNAADPLVRIEADGSDGSWLIRTHKK